MSGLAPFMDPESIAIIGASSNPDSMASRPLQFLQKYGYRGKIFPVNPRYQEIGGLTCFPDIESVPAPIDLALLMVSASNVLEMLRRCAAHGVRGALVYAGGFAELGGEGKKAQAAISELARTTGMRILGPNCQGAVNFSTNLVSNFSSALQVGTPLPGSVAIAAQSGAVSGVLYPEALKIGMGIQAMVATGNEADLDVSDCIEYLVQMPEISSVGCFIEGLKDYAKFVRAAETGHREGKPIVVVKPGRTSAGRSAALSHTGALVGEDRVYEAVFERVNAIRVDDIVALMYTCFLFSRGKPLGEGRVAIITNSGGIGVMLADMVETMGFSLATLSEPTRKILQKRFPDFVKVGNPIDPSVGFLDPEFFDELLPALEADPNVDIILSFTGMAQTGTDFPLNRMIRAISFAHTTGTKPIIPIWMGSSGEALNVLRSRGVPVFTEPAQCMSALSSRLRWERRRNNVRFPKVPAWSAHESVDGRPPVSLSVAESTDFLTKWNIPMATSLLCASPAEAEAAARKIGFPVALKISSRDVPHKSEVGGLRLDLGTGEAVRDAAEEMLARLGSSGVRIDGLQVQQMAPPRGLEVIAGARWDPVFGSVLMVGLGGIYAEILDDTAVAIAPLDEAEVLATLRKLKSFPLFDGARGQPRRDVRALANLLVTLSRQAVSAGPAIQEVDLNPVLVYEEGYGVLVVDALVVGHFTTDLEIGAD